MRVVYWGIGKFFHDAKRRMDMFVDAFRDEVAAFVDNNSRLWGTFFDGKIVMSP